MPTVWDKSRTLIMGSSSFLGLIAASQSHAPAAGPDACFVLLLQQSVIFPGVGGKKDEASVFANQQILISCSSDWGATCLIQHHSGD